MYVFGKELYYDEKARGKKSDRDRSLTRLFNSPVIMAPGISPLILSKNFNEFYKKLKLLLQKNQAGNNFNTFDKEIVAIADKLLEHKFKYTKQHEILLNKYLH